MSKVELWQNAIETRHGRPFESLVKELVEAGRTQEEIAAFLGLPYWSFRYLLRQRGARFFRTVEFDGEEQLVSP